MFEPKIVVDGDKCRIDLCSDQAIFGPSPIRDLSPEQAVEIKNQLIYAYRSGFSDAVRKVLQTVQEFRSDAVIG